MSTAVHVTGSNLTYVFIVLGISLVALAIAYGLRAQVLAQSCLLYTSDAADE